MLGGGCVQDVRNDQEALRVEQLLLRAFRRAQQQRNDGEECGATKNIRIFHKPKIKTPPDFIVNKCSCFTVVWKIDLCEQWKEHGDAPDGVQ